MNHAHILMCQCSAERHIRTVVVAPQARALRPHVTCVRALGLSERAGAHRRAWTYVFHWSSAERAAQMAYCKVPCARRASGRRACRICRFREPLHTREFSCAPYALSALSAFFCLLSSCSRIVCIRCWRLCAVPAPSCVCVFPSSEGAPSGARWFSLLCECVHTAPVREREAARAGLTIQGCGGGRTDGRRRRAPVEGGGRRWPTRAASRLVRRVPGRHAVTARVPTVFSSVGNYTSLAKCHGKSIGGGG